MLARVRAVFSARESESVGDVLVATRGPPRFILGATNRTAFGYHVVGFGDMLVTRFVVDRVHTAVKGHR
ncbi:hypothetical protein GCM10009816_06030 [Microbacterium aquimaris]